MQASKMNHDGRSKRSYTQSELQTASILLAAGAQRVADRRLPEPLPPKKRNKQKKIAEVQGVVVVPTIKKPRKKIVSTESPIDKRSPSNSSCNDTDKTPPKNSAAKTNTSKKRMRRDSESKEGLPVEDGKEKSERKRQREKQRRSELTNAFEEMHSFILRLDTAADGDDDEGSQSQGGGDPEGRKKQRRLSTSRNNTNHEGDDGGMTTRVDLINRALTIMKRLHHENAEMKQSLSRSGGGRDKNEVRTTDS